jgi:hypothetical protein
LLGLIFSTYYPVDNNGKSDVDGYMSKEDDCRLFFGAFSNKPLQQHHGTNGEVVTVHLAPESDLDFQKDGTATTLVSAGTKRESSSYRHDEKLSFLSRAGTRRNKT